MDTLYPYQRHSSPGDKSIHFNHSAAQKLCLPTKPPPNYEQVPSSLGDGRVRDPCTPPPPNPCNPSGEGT